eukprot:747774-Hanusia_phi.AAC.1
MERIRGSVQSLGKRRRQRREGGGVGVGLASLSSRLQGTRGIRQQEAWELALADVCAGRAFGVYMSRLTDTHLSLGVDEEKNVYAYYFIRMRLPQ